MVDGMGLCARIPRVMFPPMVVLAWCTVCMTITYYYAKTSLPIWQPTTTISVRHSVPSIMPNSFSIWHLRFVCAPLAIKNHPKDFPPFDHEKNLLLLNWWCLSVITALAHFPPFLMYHHLYSHSPCRYIKIQCLWTYKYPVWSSIWVLISWISSVQYVFSRFITGCECRLNTFKVCCLHCMYWYMKQKQLKWRR
jgi:hypothetical protein